MGGGKAKRRQKPMNFLDLRKSTLREVMLSGGPDLQERIRVLHFSFFDDDLKQGRAQKIENTERPDNEKEINVCRNVLWVISQMPEKKKPIGRQTSKWILENFESWLEQNDADKEIQKEFLDEEVKSYASFLACQDIELAPLLCKLFLVDPGLLKKAMMDKMEKHLELRQFKDACEYAITNKLVEEFTFEQLVLPLILADKIQTAFELLVISKKFQKDYVAFLDSFWDKSQDDIEEFFKPYREKGIVHIDLRRYHEDSLHTLIHKFFANAVRTYKFDLIEARDAPRYDKISKMKAVRFFVLSRFDEKKARCPMKDEVYVQHIDAHLDKCEPSITKYLIKYLWMCDIEHLVRIEKIDAIRWVIRRKIDPSLVPESLLAILDDPDNELVKEAKIGVRQNEERMHAQYPEPGEQMYVSEGDEVPIPIRIIATPERLDDFCLKLQSLEKTEDDVIYMGYDSEWRPTLVTDSKKSRLSLMQFFFGGETWVIDVVVLEDMNLPGEAWQKLLTCILKSPKIKLVGFDLKNDLEALLTVPGLQNQLDVEKCTTALCIKRMAENLCEVDMNILKLERATFRLKDLSQQVIGRNMNKQEQASDWTTRPLRTSQWIYAANDAVTVLLIFEKILEIVRKTPRVSVKNLLNSITVRALGQDDARKKWQRKNTIAWKDVNTTIHRCCDPLKPLKKPAEFKILTDTMFCGLGKTLSLLGMDVTATRTIPDLEREVTACLTSNPYDYFVTTYSVKPIFDEFQDQLILIREIRNKEILNQLAEFCSYVNIDIKEDDEAIRRNYESADSLEEEETDQVVGTTV